MNFLLYFLVSLISIFYFIKLCKNKNILLSHSGEKHQEYVSKNSVPLIGGIYLFFLFLFFFFKFEKYLELVVFSCIFLLGIFTDFKILKSPKKRLVIQGLFLILLVSVSKLQIIDTRIDFFNLLLENKIINFSFVIFCLLILMNGSNFIDGLNGLVIGYFLMILAILIKINFFGFYFMNQYDTLFFILTLFLIFLLNIFNKLYLGDNGVYVLSIFFGLMIIDYHNNFPTVSPYFFILILWYPCFENLFSIIRKFKLKRSPINPDTNHFHQLLFYFLKKKNSFTDLANNNLSSFTILIFNLIIFMFALIDIYSTKLQITAISFSVIIYVIMYIYLFKFKYEK